MKIRWDFGFPRFMFFARAGLVGGDLFFPIFPRADGCFTRAGLAPVFSGSAEKTWRNW